MSDIPSGFYNMLLAFSRNPGGFRELREVGRNHFHLSWYLSDAVVTSQVIAKSLRGFYTEYGIKCPWGPYKGSC